MQEANSPTLQFLYKSEVMLPHKLMAYGTSSEVLNHKVELITQAGAHCSLGREKKNKWRGERKTNQKT